MDPTGMFANQFGVDIGLRWPQLATPIPPETDTSGCTPDSMILPRPSCGVDNAPCRILDIEQFYVRYRTDKVQAAR